MYNIVCYHTRILFYYIILYDNITKNVAIKQTRSRKKIKERKIDLEKEMRKKRKERERGSELTNR